MDQKVHIQELCMKNVVYGVPPRYWIACLMYQP